MVLWIFFFVLIIILFYERLIIYRFILRLKSDANIKRINLLDLLDLHRTFNLLLDVINSGSANKTAGPVSKKDVSSDMLILHNLTRELTKVKDLDSLYKMILKTFVMLSGATRASIALYDKTNDLFEIKSGEEIDIQNIESLKFRRGEGLIWECVKKNDIFFVYDTSKSVAYKRLSTDQNESAEAVLLIPLKVDEKIIAVISLSIPQKYGYTLRRDSAILESTAGICAAHIQSIQLLGDVIKNKVLERQIKMTKSIQNNLLQMEKIKMPDYEIAYNMLSALQISGDFYIMRKVNSESGLILSLADVVGKGFSSALIMAITKIALELYIDSFRGPGDIKNVLVKLNELILKYVNDKEKFITIFFSYLDFDTGELFYVNCGHTYPVIYRHREDKFIFLREKGIALGFIDEISEYLQVYKAHLDPCDFLFLYSDGVLDAKNKDNIFLEEKGFLDILYYLKREKSAHLKAQRFEEELKRYMQREQTDDITYIFLERKDGFS